MPDVTNVTALHSVLICQLPSAALLRCLESIDSHTELFSLALSSVPVPTALLRRTLLYGGVAMNPRSHLRLVYEANPLAFLAEQARTSAASRTPSTLYPTQFS